MTAAITHSFTNPYYGINQANGARPADKIAQDAAATIASTASAAATDQKDPTQDFLDYAKLSVAERIRKQFLESKGLDEKSLAAMDEKERQKIEDEFRDMLKKKMKDGVARDTGLQTGLIANILA